MRAVSSREMREVYLCMWMGGGVGFVLVLCFGPLPYTFGADVGHAPEAHAAGLIIG